RSRSSAGRRSSPSAATSASGSDPAAWEAGLPPTQVREREKSPRASWRRRAQRFGARPKKGEGRPACEQEPRSSARAREGARQLIQREGLADAAHRAVDAVGIEDGDHAAEVLGEALRVGGVEAIEADPAAVHRALDRALREE